MVGCASACRMLPSRGNSFQGQEIVDLVVRFARENVTWGYVAQDSGIGPDSVHGSGNVYR